ncbi:hypothetical protein Dtox_2501 [Desulfofarcimen acetoxidans DSM 771]|uniref:Uncharacterized protein n=1 Tax=Desulfofarcimen acetoxidans (strain ATCC 49208 / DSM 771 / KCTC 5769 / VKM B-1644 / 5575) TaxID=485916 RepID=C8W0Q2_DESAS|nr:hypothetical protein [Desulfofarcimen acetoxidans]ACV63307.1 hypothetical protein Dtox_2501 [Desulfofarcimen acetoxidans DSM 771]
MKKVKADDKQKSGRTYRKEEKNGINNTNLFTISDPKGISIKFKRTSQKNSQHKSYNQPIELLNSERYRQQNCNNKENGYHLITTLTTVEVAHIFIIMVSFSAIFVAALNGVIDIKLSITFLLLVFTGLWRKYFPTPAISRLTRH